MTSFSMKNSVKRSNSLLAVIVAVFICNDAASADNITMVSQNDDMIVFETTLPFPDISDVKGADFKKISVNGFETIAENGAPGVVTRGVMIEIPPGCEVELKVITLEKAGIENFILAPSPERVLVKNSKGFKVADKRFIVNKSLYSINEFYPGKLVEAEFTGFLRGRRVAKLNLFPVQYNPVSRLLEIHEKMRIYVKFRCAADKECDSRSNKYDRIPEESPFEKIYESCLLNYNQFGDSGTAKHLAQEDSSDGFWYAELKQSPFAVKAAVMEEGICKITYDDLAFSGIDLSGTTNENISVANQGQEVAIYCSGTGQFLPGDYILFYSESFKSLYSRKNIYWIYQGGGNGKRMPEKAGRPVSGYPVQNSFKNILHAEKDTEYWANILPYDEGVDHWFWDKLSVIEPPLKKNFSVNLRNIDKSSGGYSMKLNLRGETNTPQNPDHHTKLFVNGNLTDDFTWEGQVELIQVVDNIDPSFFIEGDNTVTVEAVDDTGATVDSYYINWFDIEFRDLFVAENDLLKFYSEGTGGVTYEISGFSSNDVWSFNVTDPANVSIITNASVAQTGSTWKMSFEDEDSDNRTYYAISSSAFKSPSEMIIDEPSDLRAGRDSVDYIIISHENFYDAIQELKQYRESKGLAVEIVKIQDIYDEFSYGIKDAEAIKHFLTHAYNSWHKTDHPTYLLIVGDASLDYRDDKGNFAFGNEDLVPTYIFQTNIIGDTPTDNWFVCVDGSDYLPDMFVGRFCVKAEEDLRKIIDKIKKYEKAKFSAWNEKVVLVADDETMFESVSDALAALLPDGFSAEKLYLSQYENVKPATDDLIDYINAGAVITNYTGHGHIDEWASENLFQTPDERVGNDRNDVDRLTNQDKLTFLITLNCLNGFFAHWVDDYSLAEEFFRAENRGSIACFAPTSTGYPSEHRVLAENVFRMFFKEENNLLGSLVTAAKISSYSKIASRDMIETFTLFGDPATELKLAVDSSVSDFELTNPEDQAVLPETPPGTFSWIESLYEQFKVQYSTGPAFTSETTITVPLFPFVTVASGEYTPNIFVWSILNIMCSRNKILYWRVIAYDEDFNPMRESDYRSFSIKK